MDTSFLPRLSMVYTFSLEFEGGLEKFFFPKILQTFFFLNNLRMGTGQ